MTRPWAVLLAALLVSAPIGAVSDVPHDVDWTSYNNDLKSHRYSVLAEITAANAATLHRVCSRELGEQGSLQTGLLVVGGVIYATTTHETLALDARNCSLIWRSRYRPADKEPFFVNRGVALAGDRLIRGQTDGHLVAYDRATGKTIWNVAPANPKVGEFLSAAPIVWQNLVFIGTAGSDWGIKGRMMAFDVVTGKKRWSFTTIASGNGSGANSWGSVRAQETGGGGTWTSYTVDAATGELFVPVANPAPDFASVYRPGANLYTDSVVVLDAATGKLKWYYQAVAHDIHDWDISAPPVLYTSSDGKSMVSVASKDGYIYSVDRSTHQLAFRTPGVRMINASKPATIQGTHICPGVLGGSEWNGPAYDEQHHMLIAPMTDWCATYKLGAARYIPGGFFYGGSFTMDPIPAGRGTLTAVDADSGAVRWKYRAPAPMLAGVTPTAGGVIFTGDMAGNFLVFDSQSGKVVFKENTKGAIAGGVVTYATGGKQYVALTSGNVSRILWGVIGRPSVMVYSR